MKALLKVGYACNENCTFCHTADLREHADTADRVAWKIERAKRLGATMVVLSGGEPTIRPELLAWARRVAALDLDLGLVTNGLLLSYPDVADELLERCRLRYVYMSLHGGDAKVHRSVVRADTFDAAMKAIERLHGKIADFTINCVVTTANAGRLRGVVDRLLPFADLTIKLSMTQPKGAADRAFDVIVPDVEACAASVKDAIDYGLERARELPRSPRFAHDGIPLCLLPGLEDLYDDLKTHRFATMIEADEDDFVPVDDVAKVHPPPCDGCSLRGPCPGLYRGYFEARGDGALRPVTGGARSNSYHYVPERDVARPPGAACPILRDGTTPYDRGRTLFLRLEDRMRLFRAETRDFTDAEILETKESLGQIYLDVSTKIAPDDFARDLRKLVPSAECAACPARPRCTGCWTAAAPADVFARDDEEVMEVLRALRGRVLDLGCGEGRYLAALDRPDVEYTGVDPDEASIRRLAKKHPRHRFVAADAESFEGGPVDHVLVLRSYNHLRDPARAIDAALERLAPLGTLLLADNIAFGLVRTKAQADRAERAPGARFEHHRNDGAEQAARRLAGRPVVLERRRDAGPRTSNQWMLLYRKAAPA